MFPDSQNFEQKYYNFFETKLRLADFVKKFEIDFDKPWYQIYMHMPLLNFFAWLFWLVPQIWGVLVPVMIGYILETQNWNWFWFLVIGYVIRFAMSGVALYFFTIIEKSISLSLQYYFTRFFMLVDPIYLSTRSSGQIISKVTRGTGSAYNLWIQLIFTFSTTIVAVITSVAILFTANLGLGLFAMSFSIFHVLIISYLLAKSNKIMVPKVIKAEDRYKAMQIEALQQTHFIRSAFATKEADQRLYKKALIASEKQGIKSMSVILILTGSWYLYVVNIAVAIVWLLFLINSGAVSVVIAVAMILSYNAVLYRIIDIGNTVEQSINYVMDIQDLFDFVRNFGKQTFPVLPDDNTR